MSNALASAFVHVIPSLDGAGKTIQSELSGQISGAVEKAVPDSVGAGMAGRIASGFESAGARVGAIGKGLTTKVTAPLVGIGVAAVAVGATYEQSMNTIRARTGMAADETYGLGRAFRDMALSGRYGAHSAQDIAAAYSSIAVEGQDSAHATELMRTSMILADAVGKDLGGTAYFLGNYLLKVGKDASYAEKYMNIFAAANRKTGIGLTSLQDYLFRSNVTLQATNISGTKASAMFGRLYEAGIRGAQAYSGLENSMRSLLTPTEAQTEALERLGVARYDENGQLRDGIPFLKDVAAALGDLEGAQFAYYTELLGSTAMGSAFLGGMVDIKDVLPDTISGLYGAADAYDGLGIAAHMADINNEGLNTGLARLKNVGKEFFHQISAVILPIVTDFISRMTDLVKRFADLDPEMQRNIVKWAAIAAAAGPVLVIAGKMLTGIGKLIRIFATFGRGIGLTVKAVKLFTTTSGGLATKFKTVANAAANVSRVFGTLKTIFKAVKAVKLLKVAIAGIKVVAIGAIVGAVVWLIDKTLGLQNIWEGLKIVWGVVMDALRAGWEWLQGAFAAVVDAISPVVEWFQSLSIAIGENSVVMDILKGLLIGLTGPIGWVLAGLADLGSQSIETREATERLELAQEGYRNSLDRVRDAHRGVLDAMDKLRDAQEKARDANFRLERATLSAERAQDHFNETLERFGKDSREHREACLRLREAQAELDGATRGAARAADEATHAREAEMRAHGRANKEVRESERQQKSYRRELANNAIETGDLTALTRHMGDTTAATWTHMCQTVATSSRGIVQDIDTVTTAGNNMFDAVPGAASQNFGQVASIARSETSGLQGQMHTTGVNAVNGLDAGMRSRFDRLNATAARAAQIVSRGVSSGLQERSPSRVLMRSGRNAIAGLIVGMEQLAPKLYDAVSEIASIVSEKMCIAGQIEIARPAYPGIPNMPHGDFKPGQPPQNVTYENHFHVPVVSHYDVISAQRTNERQMARGR